MSNAYWSGAELAYVTEDQIDAANVKRLGGRAVRAMNLAFRIYQNGIVFAVQGGALRLMITSDLHDAARTGWGTGVSDLEEAFEHLATNRGRWKDTNTKNYWGGPEGVGALDGHGWVETTTSAVNFLSAVDDKLKKLQKLIDAHTEGANKVADVMSNPEWNKVGTAQWEKAGDGLKTVKSVNENIGRYLWLAGARYENLSEVGEKASEHFGKFFEAAEATRTAVETFERARIAGFSNAASGALAAIQFGAGKVPVLGELYGEAIGLIPVIAANFQAIAERQRNRMRIALYGPGAGEQMDW